MISYQVCKACDRGEEWFARETAKLFALGSEQDYTLGMVASELRAIRDLKSQSVFLKTCQRATLLTAAYTFGEWGAHRWLAMPVRGLVDAYCRNVASVSIEAIEAEWSNAISAALGEISAADKTAVSIFDRGLHPSEVPTWYPSLGTLSRLAATSKALCVALHKLPKAEVAK